MESVSKTVCVIGNGYVGLPLCVLMKDSGHNVIGFDANAKVIESLQMGVSTVEDVTDDELQGCQFTCDPVEIEHADVYVICVPTPVTEEKKTPDLRIVQAVKKTLLKHARPGSLIILESTVGVGDTKKTFSDFVDMGFYVANSPERIDPSRKEPTLKNIPKVVGGVNTESTKVAAAFYDTVFTQVVPVKDSNHSEATKLLENSYRAINIQFINEYSDFCDKAGMDVREIVGAAKTKPYGFSAFMPWIGVGGHCIPVDPHYLIESEPKCDWPILSQTMKAMHERPSKLARERITPTTQNVLVCGVSYKPNVSDTRDAPQYGFIKQMQDSGVNVDYYDPMVDAFMDLNRVESLDRIDNYDKVFVMHQHKDHPQLDALRSLETVEFFC